MAIFIPVDNARIMDFRQGIGLRPDLRACIENKGDDDLVFLEMSAAPEFPDVPSTNGSATCQNSSSRTTQSLTDREIDELPNDKTPVLM
jgi:oxalate decarboxylase